MTPPDAPLDGAPSLLIAYDGSDDARNAIEVAARVMPGARCTILTAWQPFVDTVTRAGGGFGFVGEVDDSEQLDRATEQAAQRSAEEGAAVARDAGLEAEAHTTTRSGNAAYTILDEAKAAGATMIVMGSRGLSGVRSLVLGSVSHAVLNHADRPVLIVPHPQRAGDAGS
jgi:nucleotide-binding universal stress UspA family protein